MAPPHAWPSSLETNAPDDELNGGIRVKIPFRGEWGAVAVAECAPPTFSMKKSLFSTAKNSASGFAPSLRLIHWESDSPEGVHRVLAVNPAGLRHRDPSHRQLTPLPEVVASVSSGSDSKRLPERAAHTKPNAEADDCRGYPVSRVLNSNETVVSAAYVTDR